MFDPPGFDESGALKPVNMISNSLLSLPRVLSVSYHFSAFNFTFNFSFVLSLSRVTSSNFADSISFSPLMLLSPSKKSSFLSAINCFNTVSLIFLKLSASISSIDVPNVATLTSAFAAVGSPVGLGWSGENSVIVIVKSPDSVVPILPSLSYQVLAANLNDNVNFVSSSATTLNVGLIIWSACLTSWSPSNKLATLLKTNFCLEVNSSFSKPSLNSWDVVFFASSANCEILISDFAVVAFLVVDSVVV